MKDSKITPKGQTKSTTTNSTKKSTTTCGCKK